VIKGNGKTQWKSLSNTTVAILLVLVAAVLFTLLSERHRILWDLTSTGEHTLSPKTVQVLKALPDPVTIKAFVREGFPEAEAARRLLDAYRYQAPTIQYELIDPERNPSAARQYDVKNINTFILQGADRSQTVKLADEQYITNGLVRLMDGKTQKLYWITGHGERVFDQAKPDSLSRLRETLQEENMEFVPWNLMQGDLPGDASMVVLAAPQKALLPEEVDSLRGYLHKGGRLLVFLEPFTGSEMNEFLQDHGIRLADDIIVDKFSRAMGGDYLLPMVANYGSHAITEDFQLTSLFYVARSVEVDQGERKGVASTPLAYTSANSWAETDRASLDAGEAQFDEKDRKGPICLATIAELEAAAPAPGSENGQETVVEPIGGNGKLVVFGDVDFASNRFFQLAGNGDFIQNTINYLVGREDLITIQKEPRPVQPLMLSRTQGSIVFWLTVVLMPLGVLILGIVSWFRRRSR